MTVGENDRRIGPNAITRVAEALLLYHGASSRDRIFGVAGLTHHLRHPPIRMVPDEDVAMLHLALANVLGVDEARRVGAEAGRLTAGYLLANRIPRAAQSTLGLLPRRLALRLLLKAIAAHAWTFAGAGKFSYQLGQTVTLAIEGGPVSRHISTDSPVCDYYAATFETLFKAIISDSISVSETACQAQGASACEFSVALR